jgi:hypothetical protein
MPKLPSDANMQRILDLPIAERVIGLVISVIEADRKNSIAIIKTFLAIIESIANAQGSASRFAFADLLHKCANEIERPVTVKQ